ncbi:Hypothetical_protein [Hexamita inflata]|uniref:Hypothetical_protein n=1 Tax=Hexamita inflata TaxID=28002 RepID=A0AA86R1I6_9EUKA|nr:Hypothetical protein HINF_LOCUS51758 [Hexamita inflata]
MFAIKNQFGLQPAQGILLIFSFILGDISALVYCVMRFKKQQYEISQLVSVVFKALIVSKFQNLTNLTQKQKIVRLFIGTLYGAAHFVVVMNIFDRNFFQMSLVQGFSTSIYVGYETIQQLVYFFGFSLRKGLFGIMDSPISPKKSLILLQIYQGIIAFTVAIFYCFFTNQLNKFAMYLSLISVSIKIVGFFVTFIVYYRRWNDKIKVELIQTKKVE